MLPLNNRFYYETTDSTNTRLKAFYKEGCLEGTICSAGCQTAGKGRTGHQWKSPEHESVSTSMILYPDVKMEHVGTITLLSGLAVVKAVEDVFLEKGLQEMLCDEYAPKIKWPNDAVLKNRKICGILTEMSATKGKVDYVITGIGVNVHSRSFPEEIKDKATSLDLMIEEWQKKNQRKEKIHISRREIEDGIWRNFVRLYDQYLKTEDMTYCMDEYNSCLVNKDKQVRVLDPLGEYEGIARGINLRGELLVETSEGIREVDSGEVSVRGLYGYV